MNNTFEQFLQAYTKASPAVRELIDSEKIGLLCESVLQGVNNSVAGLKPKLIVQTSNYILSILSETDLQKNLHALSLDPATTAVLINGAKKLKVDILTTETLVPKSGSISTEIAEAEALLSTMNPEKTIRTMPAGGGSASAETVYTSTQSAILEEGRMRSMNTPTTSGGTAPRWDSAK